MEIRIQLECRPAHLFGANYRNLPFPNIGPMQEVAFDVGVTVLHGAAVLHGLVFKAYNEHQLLFEQRWSSLVIKERIGEDDLTIAEGTGIAIRGLQFMMHGYQPITHVDIVAVARTEPDNTAIQDLLRVPVTFPKQQTDLYLPIVGTWWVIQASDWSDQHKRESYSQTYALDFVQLGPNSRMFHSDGMSLEDHYSWDQPVLAAAGGKIAYVGYDMPDMLPGAVPDPVMMQGDLRRILGNAVAISHANGEFSYYAHLQQASIEVRVGDLVRRGSQIARVGNSGQSPGPHLHIHLMNGPNLFIDQGLPAKFSHFWAAGQFFENPTTIPTRMIVSG